MSGRPWLVAAAEGAAFTGGELKRYRSSAGAQRGFCAGCGTPGMPERI